MWFSLWPVTVRHDCHTPIHTQSHRNTHNIFVAFLCDESQYEPHDCHEPHDCQFWAWRVTARTYTFVVYLTGSKYVVYGVAMISRLLKIIGLFCRISSLLQGSFAKETYNFKEPTTCCHPIVLTVTRHGQTVTWLLHYNTHAVTPQYTHYIFVACQAFCCVSVRHNHCCSRIFVHVRASIYVYVCVYVYVCMSMS